MADTENKQTVRLTIDGTQVQVPKGTSVFEAAEKAGVFVPHYCYHPDLSVAGVCRMCMVEIENVPRLQISCNTMATDGMVVHTKTDKVNASVKGTLEMHLINHPLDCPICDKAGECGLQNFYQDYGLYKSRMNYEKVHKPKVVDIGSIVLDSERCILCSRCVRFTSEVTKTHELGIFNRGDQSELKTYDDGPLRNDYTGNLADICPVGALTAKDFRFQCRVWFLDKAKSVCTQCSRGCNTVVSVNPTTSKLYRVEPRRNVDVNKSWICDTGRWDFHYVHDESRIQTPLQQVDSKRAELTWNQVFQTLSQILTDRGESVLVGLSGQLTNEEVVDALLTLPKLGVAHLTWLVDENVVGETEAYDGILKHRDRTPNAFGLKRLAKLFGVKLLSQAEVNAKIAEGKVSDFWLLGLEGKNLEWVKEQVNQIQTVNYLAHSTSFEPYLENFSLVLPNVSSFEKSGTLVNALGRIQKLQASLPKQHTARDLHDFLFGLSLGNDRERPQARRSEKIFEELISTKLVGKKSHWKDLSLQGESLCVSEASA